VLVVVEVLVVVCVVVDVVVEVEVVVGIGVGANIVVLVVVGDVVVDVVMEVKQSDNVAPPGTSLRTGTAVAPCSDAKLVVLGDTASKSYQSNAGVGAGASGCCGV